MATPGGIKMTWTERDRRTDPYQLAWGGEGDAPGKTVIEWAAGPIPQGEAGRQLVQAVLASLGCDTSALAPARVDPDGREASVEIRAAEFCLSGVS